jgi:hypothetical protein
MAQTKKTAEAVKREVDQLKEQIAALKEQAQEHGQAFSSLNEEQLAKKVRGETSKSPFIFAQSWTSGTTPGSTANYTVHVRNPDPTGYFPFYATIFFGLGNFFAAEQGWIGRDKRWPEFSSDRTFFPANSDRSFSFTYSVPSGLPLGTYNGNSVLWRGEFHDVGAAFDRGSFDVKLS